MSTFCYKARNKENKLVEGSIDDDTLDDALDSLKKLELLPVDIQAECADGHRDPLVHASTRGINLKQYLAPIRSVGGLTIFTRRLGELLSLKIPLIEALELSSRNTSRELKKTIENLISDILSGSTLEASVSRNPEVFPTFYVSLLQTHGQTEKLHKSISNLAEYLEKKQSLISRWKNHFFIFLSAICLIPIFVTAILYTFVPYFEAVSRVSGIAFSPAADVMINLSHIIKTISFPSAVFFILFPISLWAFSTVEKYRIRLYEFLIFIPVIGKCVQTLNIALFSRGVVYSLQRGFGIHDAISFTIPEIPNCVYAKEFKTAADAIRTGKSVSSALSALKHVPQFMGRMFSSGETHDELILDFSSVSGYFTREFEYHLSRFRFRLIIPAVLAAVLALLCVPALFFLSGF